MTDWGRYFTENSRNWVDEAYTEADYTYPVGAHRLRILRKIMSKYKLDGKKCLDIGCGGGDISLFLALSGANVTGIDMTQNMLDIASDKTKTLPADISRRVEFMKANVLDLPHDIRKNKYDVIIAYGLIGYLESDEKFFEIVNEISSSNTVLILSCRNRLFNITSVTPNTVKEIRTGAAEGLIDEINGYYIDKLPEEHIQAFMNMLVNGTKHVADLFMNSDLSIPDYEDSLPGTGHNQPRSSSPKALNQTAKSFGFRNVSMHGVHPHLLLPRMNKMLPPRVFNVLSDSLCAFEDDPVSLIYSSVYVGEFVKE